MVVKVINKSNNNLPAYEHEGDAGMDIRVDFSRVTPQNPIKVYGDGELIFANDHYSKTLIRLEPGARAILPTGIFTAIPKGYEVQLRPRSGLAIKKGLSLINAIGTIDHGYRNEWGIPVVNNGLESIWIEDGERVAQAILNKFETIEWKEVEKLSESERGLGGFGSSGTL